MAKTDTLNAICAQLLTTEDLSIDEALFRQVVEERIVTRIELDETRASVRIFSLEKRTAKTAFWSFMFLSFDIVSSFVLRYLSASGGFEFNLMHYRYCIYIIRSP